MSKLFDTKKMATSQNEMRIVLVGKTGNGKSATGNSILHSRSAFYSTQSSASITRHCKVGQYQHTDKSNRQRRLVVVDTPGFFDTNTEITNEMVKKKIASQIFEMTAPGVHAFLIVIRIGRITLEEKNTIDFIRHIFGPDAAKYCIVVFTDEDRLEVGQTLKEFIEASPEIEKLVEDCRHRIFSINNCLNGERLEKKTNELIEIIDNMIRNNNGNFYTNDEYQRIEKEREDERKKKEEEERQEEKTKEDVITARIQAEERKKHEEEMRKLRSESDSARRSHDNTKIVTDLLMEGMRCWRLGGGGNMTSSDYPTTRGGYHSMVQGDHHSVASNDDYPTTRGGYHSMVRGGHHSVASNDDYPTTRGGYHSMVRGGHHSVDSDDDYPTTRSGSHSRARGGRGH